jgi:putative transposase
MKKTINLEYKYKFFPTIEQKALLDYNIFIYNQAYNICLRRWRKDLRENEKLGKNNKQQERSPESYDAIIEQTLNSKRLPFLPVVIRQARVNFLKDLKLAYSKKMITERRKAIKNAKTPKEKKKASKLGIPQFKTKGIRQSFIWDEKKISIEENGDYAILSLMELDLRMVYHQKLPNGYRLTSALLSREETGYYINIKFSFVRI